MAEKTMRRGRKADYTDRPLNEVEKVFAGDEKNYNQLFKFMRINRLDPEEWYDILIIPYLKAVKKYCSREELQVYPFFAILKKILSRAVFEEFRKSRAQKRMPEGGIVSLDYMVEGDNPFSEYTLDVYWIDKTKNVEAYVVEKEFLHDMLSNVNRYADPELLKMVIEMRMEGFTDTEIARRARCELEEYKDWTLAEIKNLIRILTLHRSSNSPLSRLVRDTKEYGNIEDYYKWEELREELEI